jgi:hypothetical protein
LVSGKFKIVNVNVRDVMMKKAIKDKEQIFYDLGRPNKKRKIAYLAREFNIKCFCVV